LQELQNLSSVGGSPVEADPEEEPDIFALASIDAFTPEIQAAIQSAFAEMKKNPEKFTEGGYRLAAFSDEGDFYVNRPLPESLIRQLDLKITPAQFVRSEKYTPESGRGF
jgi:hypothetical protein